MSSHPPGGWYPGQHDRALEHYWDGTGWTGETRPNADPDAENTVPISYRPPDRTGADPRGTPDSPGPPRGATTRLPAGEPERPWHTRWWVVGGAALVVGLLVGAAATGGRDLSSAAEPAARPSATVTVTASPSSDPAASGSPSATGTPYSGTDQEKATFAMPDEIGKYLQDAQDDLQSISGKPFFYSGSSDASGQGRGQFLDRDWRVCNQSVAPGTQVSVDDRSISFGVVKLDEECP